MKTANASFENHHVIALFSFHTETILYQKSLFRAIGGIYVFGKKPKFHIIGIFAGKITYTSGFEKNSSPFWEAARKSFSPDCTHTWESPPPVKAAFFPMPCLPKKAVRPRR
jgi:hypothetical protein